MTLLELKDKIDAVIGRVQDAGLNPDSIPVTLQLDDGEDPAWGHESLDVVWDDNTLATGCVLVADRDV